MGDRILSVKDPGEDKADTPLLRVLLNHALDVGGVPEKAIAHALNVSPSRITDWKNAVEENRRMQVNDSTRDKILSLMEPGAILRTEGMEVALDKLRRSLTDLENAVRLRRAMEGVSISEGRGGHPEGEAGEAARPHLNGPERDGENDDDG